MKTKETIKLKMNRKKYVYNEAHIKLSTKEAFNQDDKDIFRKNIRELARK